MAEKILLNVNGTTHSVPAEPNRLLLDVLRDELNLTGTKYGCGEGQCGACTVLIDGQPRKSCVVRLASVVDKKIVTIEGIGTPDTLHPLQQAFLDAGALQCGYCTSGMILTSLALLEKNQTPSETEIVEFMNGNICRCGTYPRIIAAIQDAGRTMKGGAK